MYLEDKKDKPYPEFIKWEEEIVQDFEDIDETNSQKKASLLQEEATKRIVPLLGLNKRQRYIEDFVDPKMEKKKRASIEKLDYNQLVELKNSMTDYLRDKDSISPFEYIGFPSNKKNSDVEESGSLIKDIYRLIKDLKKTIPVEKKPKNKKKTKTEEWEEIESDIEEGDDSSEDEEREFKKKRTDMDEQSDIFEEHEGVEENEYHEYHEGVKGHDGHEEKEEKEEKEYGEEESEKDDKTPIVQTPIIPTSTSIKTKRTKRRV